MSWPVCAATSICEVATALGIVWACEGDEEEEADVAGKDEDADDVSAEAAPFLAAEEEEAGAVEVEEDWWKATAALLRTARSLGLSHGLDWCAAASRPTSPKAAFRVPSSRSRRLPAAAVAGVATRPEKARVAVAVACGYLLP